MCAKPHIPHIRVLLFVFAIAVHAKLQWQPSQQPGYYVPTQFGVHRLQLNGVLELANNTHVPVNAHVYLKAAVQHSNPHAKPDHVLIRAIAYLYDATERV